MVRWEPGSRERLQAAAVRTISANGYEATTVAQIAAAAGVTERTFYRHFADKREVLFDGQERLLHLFTDAIRDGAANAPPLELVQAAVESGELFFDADRRAWSAERTAVIKATPELLEREARKLAGMRQAMAEALRARGVEEPAATLAAETGGAVFGMAFQRWIADDAGADYREIVRELFAGLRSVLG